MFGKARQHLGGREKRGKSLRWNLRVSQVNLIPYGGETHSRNQPLWIHPSQELKNYRVEGDELVNVLNERRVVALQFLTLSKLRGPRHLAVRILKSGSGLTGNRVHQNSG